jgi:hypothetical protein
MFLGYAVFPNDPQANIASRGSLSVFSLKFLFEYYDYGLLDISPFSK